MAPLGLNDALHAELHTQAEAMLANYQHRHQLSIRERITKKVRYGPRVLAPLPYSNRRSTEQTVDEWECRLVKMRLHLPLTRALREEEQLLCQRLAPCLQLQLKDIQSQAFKIEIARLYQKLLQAHRHALRRSMAQACSLSVQHRLVCRFPDAFAIFSGLRISCWALFTRIDCTLPRLSIDCLRKDIEIPLRHCRHVLLAMQEDSQRFGQIVHDFRQQDLHGLRLTQEAMQQLRELTSRLLPQCTS